MTILAFGLASQAQAKDLLYPAHNFVLHGGISKLHGKTFVVCEDHVASFKVKIII